MVPFRWNILCPPLCIEVINNLPLRGQFPCDFWFLLPSLLLAEHFRLSFPQSPVLPPRKQFLGLEEILGNKLPWEIPHQVARRGRGHPRTCSLAGHISLSSDWAGPNSYSPLMKACSLPSHQHLKLETEATKETIQDSEVAASMGHWIDTVVVVLRPWLMILSLVVQ